MDDREFGIPEENRLGGRDVSDQRLDHPGIASRSTSRASQTPTISTNDGSATSSSPGTRHRFATVHGLQLFYREAGDPQKPVLLLLHGAPASSFMFRDLIPLLANDYHLIAPDYPGFGFSDSPTIDSFDYTFDALADSVDSLLHHLGVTRYAMYVQDYGAPVGWRIALRHPSSITAVITQNGNAYVEGFAESFWNPLWRYAENPNSETERPIRDGLTLDAIRWQYTHGEPDPFQVSPDAWHHDYAVLQRPGNLQVQLTLLRRYRDNIAVYPDVQRWLRSRHVPVLAVWGRNDQIFLPAGANAFLNDVPDAQIALINGGHFLLEAHASEVARLILLFLSRAQEQGKV